MKKSVEKLNSYHFQILTILVISVLHTYAKNSKIFIAVKMKMIGLMSTMLIKMAFILLCWPLQIFSILIIYDDNSD